MARIQGTGSQKKITTNPSWRKRAVEHFVIKDPELLRGMPWTRLLRKNARVLANNQGDSNTFHKSNPVESIDTFVSHTWNTPRWKKFLVLIFHFNLYPAFIISAMVSLIICILTTYGLLPSATVGDLLSRDHDAGVAGTYTRGILAMPVGVIVFFICLFTLHEIERVMAPCTRHNVFLDKTCVHQTNLELKKQGIESLAGFLQRSTSVLVLYSDAYMQRLWTIYEVASWLILHRGTPLIARPLFVPIMILVGYSFFSATDVLYFAFSLTSREPFSSLGALGLIVGIMLPEFTMVAFLAGKWAKDREQLEGHVLKFRLADAKCFCEDDRNVVRANIISFMRYAELAPSANSSDDEVCEKFEELVRTEVPRLMWSSFGRVAMPYTWALVFGWPQTLTTFDLISGNIIDSFEPRRILLLSALNIAWIGGILPLNMAFVFSITRCRWVRNIPGCLVVGLLSCGIQAVSRTVFKTMTGMSEESNAALGALLAVYAAVFAANVLIFRH